MQINGQEVISEFHNQHVYLPERYLQPGANHISLHILNKYRNDSVGLHSFIDQSDKQQYLYTQFETDYCHFVFPCFD